jgi:hypothetical protein
VSNETTAVRLTREELHARVWAEPMRTLAKEFGISDVALAKACRKAMIPLPGRGYWAKKAAGKKMRAVSLPAIRDSDQQTPRSIEFSPREKARPASAPAASHVEREAQAENKIEVADTLRRPHPLVRATLDALKESRSGRHAGYPANWQVRHLDVDVSKTMLQRAMRVMDALVKAFEARGWEVSLGRGDDRNSYVMILGQRVPFGIREPRRRVSIPPAERTSYGLDYREEPAGRLALVLRESWGHSVKRSIIETDARALEDRLNDFIVAAVAWADERAEWERRRVEAEEQRRIAERKRLDEQRRREAEEARTKDLELQAERWCRSQILETTSRPFAHVQYPRRYQSIVADWLAGSLGLRLMRIASIRST